MTPTSSALAVVLSVVGLMVAASITVTAQSAQAQYQQALVQEHAHGDLKRAIALYEQAAKASGRDRSLAAKALVRKGTSLEKLGKGAEAAATYTDLVRTYPEQRSAVSVAQERLTALRATTRDGDASPPSWLRVWQHSSGTARLTRHCRMPRIAGNSAMRRD